MPTDDFAADADAIAAAVRAVPGVSGLHGGVQGEIALLLPGRRIPGLRLHDAACEVHVAVEWDADIPQTAAAIRTRLAPLAGGRPVLVHVEDVAEPEEEDRPPANPPTRQRPAHRGPTPEGATRERLTRRGASDESPTHQGASHERPTHEGPTDQGRTRKREGRP